MPSTARKMKLLEAFETMDVAGEMTLLELAQVLAERFPKRMADCAEESANDSGVAGYGRTKPLSQRSVQMM
jgi:hypothetical protein